MIQTQAAAAEICAVSFAGEAEDAAPMLAKMGIAGAREPHPAKTNVHLHDRGDVLAVCTADGSVVSLLRRPLRAEELEAAVGAAVRMSALARAADASEQLLEVGRALGATQQDPLALQNLILNRARRLTNADAGSLMLLEEQSGGPRVLRFAVSQTGPLDGGSHVGALVPLASTSISGSVALSGASLRIEDAYAIPAGAGYAFDSSFDIRTGYRTKSVLCLPMRNYAGDVVGVIQLINRKPSFDMELKSVDQTEAVVTGFDERDESVARALAAQAGVALENGRLIESMRTLFERFVQASVTAIEVRDVATQGHSDRVAKLTVMQAQTINEIESGPFAAMHFTADHLAELRYAALLHDFGKLAVPEYIFSKAKKLPDGHLETIRMRFLLAAEQIQARAAAEKFDLMRASNRQATPEDVLEIEDRAQAAREDLFALMQSVEQANEPAVLDAAIDSALATVTQRYYADGAHRRPLLDEWEFEYLKIRRGSLSESERALMNLHVTNSYRFLSALPWNDTPWPRVAEIAYSHHELLDGSGYPRKLAGDELPPEVRMLTISDIYDALTAADRPYKKAVPVPKALDILHTEFASRGKIDRLLLDVFVAKRLYERDL